MAVQIVLKNSNVQDREVTAGQLGIGEIALNYHESGPFLQCKDSRDRIWRIGGAVIATNAPDHPARGALWYQDTTNTLHFYTGTNWVTVSTASTGTLVSSVTAGAGTVNGGTVSDIVIDVGAGTGIEVNTDDVAIDRATVDTWYAPFASPAFTGTPTAPTATAGTSTTQLATTAFVTAAVTTGTPDASETVKGIVELATAAETTTGTDSTRAVHPAGLKVELDKKAPLAGPTFTGVPKAPTATAGTNTTQLATTAFVKAAVTAGTPNASETVKGIAELATQAEVTAGTNDATIVTPLKLATAVPADTETQAGKVELATAAEVLAGTDLTRAITPKGAKDHYLAKNITLLTALP